MTTTTANRRHTVSVLVWGTAAALLCVPAVAMQFTSEVNWTASDFVIMSVLLGSLAGTYEFLVRKAPNWTYGLAAAVALLAGFLLVWINLAVGIIGSEQNDANLMFAGVIAVAIGGASLARFQAAGMAGAMLAAAGAQAMVAAVAVAFGLGSDGPVWPSDVIGTTAILTTLWLASAALFSRAARKTV